MIESIIANHDNFIFDLYGTLIDIHTDEWAKSTWTNFIVYLKSKGIRVPWWRRFRKDFFALDREYRAKATPFQYPEIDIIPVYAELFEKYGNGQLANELLNEISYKFREISREYMKLFPGLLEFLDELKAQGKKIYILSNAQASYTWPEIQFFKLDEIMDDILMSPDYGCMKPDRAFYEELLNRYNMDRTKTIMFGDSYENDYQGAINAGIDGLWLNEKNGTDSKHVYLKQENCFELYTK